MVAVVVKDVVVVGVVVVIGVVVGVVDVVVGVNVLGVVGVVDASVGPFPDPSPSPEANTSVAAGVIVVDRPGVVVVWSFPGIGLFLNEYELIVVIFGLPLMLLKPAHRQNPASVFQ